MFELSFIKKYLTPKKGQLSVSLIGLLSVIVITLVVWLVVLFLSVTEGIEKNWQTKLTALNAPLRLTPTEEYFSSYYYNIDKYSEASSYMSKTIGQKARALLTDPYNPEIDESLPFGLYQMDTKSDPVKEAFGALDEMGLTYQDVELSGALLRLDLFRKDLSSPMPADIKSQLTNVSFLASFAEKNPSMKNLILPPNENDLNQLLQFGKEKLALPHAKIRELKTASELWNIPSSLLEEGKSYVAECYKHENTITHVLIPDSPTKSQLGKIERRGKYLFYTEQGSPEYPLDLKTPIFSYGNLRFDVLGIDGGQYHVKGKLQNQTITGVVPFSGLLVAKADFQTHFAEKPTVSPLWPYFQKSGEAILPQSELENGILLAKNFQDNGVRIGDSGYLGYSSPTAMGTGEVHIPVYVAGFYDPGIMAVGNKCILVPEKITRAINASESAYTLEKSEANSILVWFDPINRAGKIKEELLQKLDARGVGKFWKVETFKEYPFAKDLMQQFQSDKYLFTLIGGLILLVACTNIISLLIILVSDRKKEIGILRAMGAKRRSIASIFALSGASLGLFSCLLGIFFAFITLKNIDHLVHFLSLIQGHDAFNAQFFGNSLPHEISPRALLFAAITTPILSLIAGLVPAIKAARLKTSDTLRSV